MLDAASAQSLQDDERLVAMASEVASLRDDNASLRGEIARAKDAPAHLRVRYHQLLEELHLLKRRLVVAKAERLDDIADAQLAFDKLLAETQAIQKVLDAAAPSDEPKDAASPKGLSPASSWRPSLRRSPRRRSPLARVLRHPRDEAGPPHAHSSAGRLAADLIGKRTARREL